MVNRLTKGGALVGALTTDDDATIGDDLVVSDDAAVLGDLTVTGDLTANGTINLGDAVAFIADPAGGGTVDTESRAAIVLILNALDSTGIMAAS